MVEVKYERKKRDIPRENQRNYKEKGLGGGGGGGGGGCLNQGKTGKGNRHLSSAHLGSFKLFNTK